MLQTHSSRVTRQADCLETGSSTSGIGTEYAAIPEILDMPVYLIFSQNSPHGSAQCQLRKFEGRFLASLQFRLVYPKKPK
jgi:hypothetical protein